MPEQASAPDGFVTFAQAYVSLGLAFEPQLDPATLGAVPNASPRGAQRPRPISSVPAPPESGVRTTGSATSAPSAGSASRVEPTSRGASPAPGAVARLATVNAFGEIDELVRRCQRGEAGAFGELFRRHRTDVGRLVYRMLGPTPDAEDVVQEVFLQVHKSLGEFRGQAKFSTWLHRVTVNVVLMVRRAARSRPVFAGEPVNDTEPDRRLLPDEDAQRRQRVAAFRRLLDRLAEKKRTVFELHELEGISPAEIAQIVDAPVLTVRTRLFYARRELAEMMRQEPTLAQLAEELAADGDDGRAAARDSNPGEGRGEPDERARAERHERKAT